MKRLTSLECYNSIFILTEEKNKFDLYNFPDSKTDGISYEKIREEIEKDLGISDITATHLQHDTIDPINIEENKEQVTKRMKNDEFIRILAIYSRYIFQDFESFLRTEIDLAENDIRLVFDDNFSNFITYELQPSIYTCKDLSKALLKFLQPQYERYHSAIDIEFDEISMKTKLIVRSVVIAIRFDEKSFFSTILGFKPQWEYKYYNEYISQKITNLSTTKNYT